MNSGASPATVICDRFLGGMIEAPVSELEFRPSVYGVIIDGSRVLLLRYAANGKRALPGGRVEKGETLPQALLREIREETGLIVRVDAFITMSERFFYYDPEGKAFQAYIFYYRCTPLAGYLTTEFNVPGDASSAPAWTAIDDVRSEDFQINGDLLVEYLRKCIEQNS